MANLRTVDIQCYYQTWDLLVPRDEHFPTAKHPLCMLVRSLHSPSLDQLHVDFQLELEFEFCAHWDSEIGMPLDFSNSLFAFTPSSKTHSPMQRLGLSVYGSKRLPCCRVLLTVPLETFPALRTLALDVEGVVQLGGSYVSPNSGSASGAFPSLERIVFVECWGGIMDSLRKIMEIRKEWDGRDDVPTLAVSVKRCPFIKEKETFENCSEEASKV